MLRLLSVHACRTCPQNAQLISAAQDTGEVVTVAPVLNDTDETRKAAALGLGLPVLVREDGAMSKDAQTWEGVGDNESAPKTPNAPERDDLLGGPAKPSKHHKSGKSED